LSGWFDNQISSAVQAGGIPATTDECVVKVLSTYSAVPGVYEEMVKQAGGEAALLAIVNQRCAALVSECGGMAEQACMDKLCPGLTAAECDKVMKDRFGGGGKKEETSSFPWWAVGLGAVVLAGAGAYWYSQQPKANPIKLYKRSMMERWLDDEVVVARWEERDRLGIWIVDVALGKTLAEWWDDEARQLFEDGFFSTKNFDRSVIEYADHVGIRPYGGTRKRVKGSNQ
jgi:hypothetical protein